MAQIIYTPITPALVYQGLLPLGEASAHRFNDILQPNKSTTNDYIDLFAEQVRRNGKQNTEWYARLMNADLRQFDGAIQCMTGMNVHGWVNNYLCLIACDLLDETNWTFKEIAEILGFSASSFSQFFRRQRKMQPWEYRSLSKHGRKKSFFLG